MLNPLLLTSIPNEQVTAPMNQVETLSTDSKLLNMDFAGLLSDEFKNFEQTLVDGMLNTEPTEQSPWQIVANKQDLNGSGLPQDGIHTVSLIMMWPEQATQPNPVAQNNVQIFSEPQHKFPTNTVTAPSPIETFTSSKSTSTSTSTSTSSPVTQHVSGMQDLTKAFFIQHTEPNNVETLNIAVESERPVPQGYSVTPGLISSTQIKTDVIAQPINIPPTRPEWGNAMGERVNWMVHNKIQSAEIRLDPPELGSVDVKIVIHKDTAHITFITHHAQARDALEQAMPRLREMFSETGLSLGDVNVSNESFKQQHSDQQNNLASESSDNDGNGGIETDIKDTELQSNGDGIILRGSGLLDTYA